MNVLIAGDFHISDSHKGKALLDPSLLSLFADADYRIVNLEAPITSGNRHNRILKTGPYLHSSRETILPPLKQLNIDLVTLANNHIMDYGQPGLVDTLASLKQAQIEATGAGANLNDAAQPMLLTRGEVRIAILNFAENEWASASDDKAGACPLDLVANIRQIRAARRTSDHVIVIIHGGFELYEYPSPSMVNRYRFYAENGASVVVGHHSHCVSGCEFHQGIPIFYGLGNLIFTEPSLFAGWYKGLILILSLHEGGGLQWTLVPVSQAKDDYTTALVEGEQKEIFMSHVEARSTIIADAKLLGQKWEEFLSARGRYYLYTFNPLNMVRNRYFKHIMIRLGLEESLREKRAVRADLEQYQMRSSCRGFEEDHRTIYQR